MEPQLFRTTTPTGGLRGNTSMSKSDKEVSRMPTSWSGEKWEVQEALQHFISWMEEWKHLRWRTKPETFVRKRARLLELGQKCGTFRWQPELTQLRSLLEENKSFKESLDAEDEWKGEKKNQRKDEPLLGMVKAGCKKKDPVCCPLIQYTH